MFKKLLSLIMPADPQTQRMQVYREFLRDAARMGGMLFGPIPEGHRREFFCLDEHTWIWHEEWIDTSGVRQVRTTRYDIRPHGIFKAQDGQPYQPLSAEETRRLYAAVSHYQQNLHAKYDSLIATAV